MFGDKDIVSEKDIVLENKRLRSDNDALKIQLSEFERSRWDISNQLDKLTESLRVAEAAREGYRQALADAYRIIAALEQSTPEGK